ncbi:MAG: hypothetical protein HY900_15955 [Deltaproteobacteria bacterium]|nr:hypothetical protein [Deltaproteobacteria bacterium]
MDPQPAYVGKRLPRPDAREKVTGQARFLPDLEFPGLLEGKILRSPHPHARILRLDSSQAKRAPGVRAVITAADTPGIPFPSVRELAQKLPLARDKVRFIGDEVAAVAAVSSEVDLPLDPLKVCEALRRRAPSEEAAT